MKKKYLILISSIILLGVIFGCSAKQEQFSDKDIILNVVDTRSTEEFRSYKIEISNKSGFDLTHLTFNLSYPIKTSNGTESNPFVIEGEAVDSERPVTLNSGNTIQFSFFAPINDVFSNTDLLDIENPDVELKGYVKERNNETPFGMSGGISFYDDNF